MERFRYLIQVTAGSFVFGPPGSIEIELQTIDLWLMVLTNGR